MTNFMDWTTITVDGLYPGMTVSQAVSMGWRTSEGVLVSEGFGREDLGFPVSFANFGEGEITAVAGKTLVKEGLVILRSGDLWKDATRVLPFENSLLTNESMDLTLMIVRSGSLLATVYFSRSSWAEQYAKRK